MVGVKSVEMSLRKRVIKTPLGAPMTRRGRIMNLPITLAHFSIIVKLITVAVN